MRPAFRVALLLTVFVVVLGCLGFTLPIELGVYLLVGSALFLVRVVPRMTVDWASIATGAIALALFVAGSHRFLGWLYAAGHQTAASAKDAVGRSANGPRWAVRWTAACVVVAISMFMAGISMVGIVHQIVWLATADGPLLVGGLRDAAFRMQSNNNLKQIGLALHDYHDRYTSLPPGGYSDADGQMMHGWMTTLLPYVDRQRLYDQIDWDETWDSPANARVFAAVIPTFLNPLVDEKTRDDQGLSHYAGNVHVLGGNRRLTFQDMADGSANTILAGEAAGNYRPWGHPANWRDPRAGINRSPDGFGAAWKSGGINVVLGDGSIRFLQDDIDPRVLEALATPSGGESLNEWRRQSEPGRRSDSQD